jgi:hypothetical protein
MFCLITIAMIGAARAVSAQTATPTLTMTPFGTPYFTPTPTPTATPAPNYILNDPHMFGWTDKPWAGTSGTTWSPHRYSIPIGEYITQTVTHITSTKSYTFTIRAQAATTSTLQVISGGTLLRTVTITRTLMRNYSFVSNLTFPGYIELKTQSGGPVVVDSVQLVRTDVMIGPMSVGGENALEPANTANIGDLADLFEPLNLPNIDLGSFEIDWAQYASPIARLTATLLSIATPRIVSYYISGRIVIMCMLWLAGFVMQKIGKPIPPGSSNNVLVNIGSSIGRGEGIEGYIRNRNPSAFPKLPPSGLRGGGRRRSRW